MEQKKSSFGRVGLATGATIVYFLLGGSDANANPDANNWGHLVFEPKITNSKTNNTLTVAKDDEYYPGASDGIDAHDIPRTAYLPNRAWINSDVNDTDLWEDYRPNSSRTPIRIKVGYKGNITEGSEPNLSLEFSWLYEGTFGTMPLILTQEDADGNNLPNGYRGDTRAEISNGGGVGSIDFGKVPAGTYTSDIAILDIRFDFEKILANLDSKNPSIVNLRDYAIFANAYKNQTAQPARSIADISNPNDVPDLIVDMYDIAKMAEQWLWRIEDGNIVSKLESIIRPIIMQREYPQTETAKKLFYGDRERQPPKPHVAKIIVMPRNPPGFYTTKLLYN